MSAKFPMGGAGPFLARSLGDTVRNLVFMAIHVPLRVGVPSHA